jgi:hypothetical protein
MTYPLPFPLPFPFTNCQWTVHATASLELFNPDGYAQLTALSGDPQNALFVVTLENRVVEPAEVLIGYGPRTAENPDDFDPTNQFQCLLGKTLGGELVKMAYRYHVEREII